MARLAIGDEERNEGNKDEEKKKKTKQENKGAYTK
jgi:hypothetical protein